MRGDEDRDRRQGVALHQALEVLVLGQARLLPDLGDRQHQQQGVEGVEGEEVGQDHDVGDSNQLAHAAYSARAWGESPRISAAMSRSEEHTSELQSQSNLVCRLLLEKK